MPFFLVTMKNPGRTPKYHEKTLGPCNMSPTCSDATGAHHTFLAEAPNLEIIFAQGLKEGMHITRVEEVYHIRKYEAADVSVRDDADQRVPSIRGTITEFDLNAVPGIQSIPRGDRPRDSDHRTGRGSIDTISPDFFSNFRYDLDAGLRRDDSSRGSGEVSGAGSIEQQDDQRSEVEEVQEPHYGPERIIGD